MSHNYYEYPRYLIEKNSNMEKFKFLNNKLEKYLSQNMILLEDIQDTKLENFLEYHKIANKSTDKCIIINGTEYKFVKLILPKGWYLKSIDTAYNWIAIYDNDYIHPLIVFDFFKEYDYDFNKQKDKLINLF